MATFKCEVVKIEDVIRHPNADTLSICKIRGFDCITSDPEPGVERYKKGEYVVYIPEGALLPEWMLKKLGMWNEAENKGYLAGPEGNRVKAIKLRGIVSQGVMYPIRMKPESGYPGPILDTRNGVCDAVLGQDVSEKLGITKYVPPIPMEMAGQVGSLHGYTLKYDIDSIQNNPDVFKEGEDVVITEKLHGTYCQIGFIFDLPQEYHDVTFKVSDRLRAYVTSKGMAEQGLVMLPTEANANNLYVKALKEYVLPKAELIESFASYAGAKAIYFMGEICGGGVQKGFNYGEKSPTFRLFDMYAIDSKEASYAPYDTFKAFAQKLGIATVPLLGRGPFNKAEIEHMVDGQTVLGYESQNPNDPAKLGPKVVPHIREGIVIRTAVEREQMGLPGNRAQLKWVSKKYLEKSTGEEIS